MNSIKKKKKIKIKPLEVNQNNKYFNIANASEYFKKIFRKYKESQERNIVYSDIYSLLSDYRNEKILQFPESEILKSEIGDEIKKYKENEMNYSTSKFITPNSPKKKNNKNKTRNKENRMSVLISLDKFRKQGKLIYPSRKQANVRSELNAKNIIMIKNDYYKNTRKSFFNNMFKKNLTYRSSSTKTFSDSTLNYNKTKKNSEEILFNLRSTYNNKLFSLSNNIRNNSINLKKSYNNYFKSFSNDYNHWKEKQYFKFPQIRIGLRKYD